MKKKRKKIFPVFLILVLCIFSLLIIKSISPNLPAAGSKATLYSNQCRQDLKMTIFRALKNAQKSIHLVMYGLTDPVMIDIINKKSEILDLNVYFDKRASASLNIKHSQAHPVYGKGLMHQKIIVIDDELVFIGSANLTTSSLLMHDNLIVGLYSPQMAKFLKEKSPFSTGFLSTMVGSQQVDLYLLPDLQQTALKKVQSLINSAASSIDLAMFTLTHPTLIEALINAKKKDINVTVYIDYTSSKGSSSKALALLKKEKIKILYVRGPQLCHHKFMLIDKRHLISGSANWTMSAFNKNYDSLLILYNLSIEQKKFMKKLLKVIDLESAFIK